MNPIAFSNNLYISCLSNSKIREDGNTLNIFNRINDFFHGRPTYTHFVSACEHFSQDATVLQMKSLSKEKQIVILGRMRQIQKKIKNTDSKDKCDLYLKKVESNLLHHEADEEYFTTTFSKIIKDVKNKRYNVDANLRNLEAIINYYSNDEKAISKIVLCWNDFYEQSKHATNDSEKIFFRSLNKKMIRILVDYEEKILNDNNSQNIEKIHLEFYPILFRLNLTNTETKGELESNISHINNSMNKYSKDPVFIQSCLKEINEYLNSIFRFGPSLPEVYRRQYSILNELFFIANDYLPLLSDKNLALDLKIKFANLPCPMNHSDFPNLFLSEKEQLTVIIEGLQLDENAWTNKICKYLTENPLNGKKIPLEDISHLAKLMSTRGYLSEENRLKLRSVFENYLKNQPPENWDNYNTVIDCLKKIFYKKQNALVSLLIPEKRENFYFTSLQRVSKAKMFFSNQLDLDETMIRIPRWFHATHFKGMNGIINSGKILVLHYQNFKGAWISTKIERQFGPCALSFTHKITDINSKVSIGYQYLDRRWRGMQKSIPMKENDATYLTLIGLPSGEKEAKKVNKLKLVCLLQDMGIPNVQVMSVDQMEILQRAVQIHVGTPNLSSNWW